MDIGIESLYVFILVEVIRDVHNCPRSTLRLIFFQGIQAFSNEVEVSEYPALVCLFDKVVIQGKGFKLYTLTFG